MTLDEYSQCFMKEVLNFKTILTKIKSWDVNQTVIDELIGRLNSEFPRLGSFEEFISDDWSKFQAVLSHAFAKEFYGEDKVLSFLEFESIKDLLENLFVETQSDKSPYTRICNKLGIFAEIPAKYISAIYSADEFTHASNVMIDELHDNMPNYDVIGNMDAYREKALETAEKCITSLNMQGYFGTHPKDILAELFMLHKIGILYAPLYVASGFGKMEFNIEELKEFTNKKYGVIK